MSGLKSKTIITARTSSSRLKNKILKKITKNKKAIDILIERAKKINFPIILCTSIHQSDNKLVNYVQRKHPSVVIFRGSLKNKLKRWYDCFKQEKIDYACMIDGDDLSFCYDLYKKSIKVLKKSKKDVIKYSEKMIPGSFTYTISLKSLKKTKKFFVKYKNSEMIDPYLKRAKLRIGVLDFPKYLTDNKSIRITLDYKEDLFFFRKLYNNVSTVCSSKKIVEYLIKNKKIKDINYYKTLSWMDNQIKKKSEIKLV